MLMNRKHFIKLLGGALAAAPACSGERSAGADAGGSDWSEVRSLFALSPEYIHLAGLLLASHPRSVREAIDGFRRRLDANPALFVAEHGQELETEVREEAAEYLEVRPEEIALTDSTTMGIGLVYNGILIQPDQEILTSEHDYYATQAAIRFKAAQTGARLRKIRLYEQVERVSEQELLQRFREGLRPETRVVAMTWVHSSTGLKIPVQAMSRIVREANRGRPEDERILLALDGVHGLGVENVAVPDLGCDFFMAGTHKWLHGPRGTGVVWGRADAHNQMRPTIPTFTRRQGWGGYMTPGGFHSFEHRWALAHAFRFHRDLGKEKIEQRIHFLSRRLKEGLAGMPHVRLYTPLSERLSSGLVCFDVSGMSPGEVVRHLLEQKIIGSETPYQPSYARLTPGIFNNEREMERTLEVIASLR